MKEFIETIARALVDNPDEVDVREVSGEKTIVYELRVNESDLGKVIGRGGQTARSIRTLLSAVSAKMGKRAVLEIIE
ncbi:RNA-binding protein [bacterium]|nr:MAG: RNA-binding protein [bacterium]